MLHEHAQSATLCSQQSTALLLQQLLHSPAKVAQLSIQDLLRGSPFAHRFLQFCSANATRSHAGQAEAKNTEETRTSLRSHFDWTSWAVCASDCDDGYVLRLSIQECKAHRRLQRLGLLAECIHDRAAQANYLFKDAKQDGDLKNISRTLVGGSTMPCHPVC